MKTEEGVGAGMKIKQDNKDEAKPTPKVVMTKQMWCVIFSISSVECQKIEEEEEEVKS